jgi:hypothetical protein
MKGSKKMAIWDASIGWVTMVVRSATAEEACEIALANVRRLKLEETVGEPEVTTDWPRLLDSEGPAELLIEDID